MGFYGFSKWVLRKGIHTFVVPWHQKVKQFLLYKTNQALKHHFTKMNPVRSPKAALHLQCDRWVKGLIFTERFRGGVAGDGSSVLISELEDFSRPNKSLLITQASSPIMPFKGHLFLSFTKAQSIFKITRGSQNMELITAGCILYKV